MPNALGRFRVAVCAGWILLASAAVVFARIRSVPPGIAALIALAFLIEFPFYLSPAWTQVRLRNPWLLALSCVAPWLLYSAPLGLITLPAAALLSAIALAVSFWFVVLPVSGLTDFAFLILLGTIRLSKVFEGIYLSPIPKVEVFTLGQIMLIRAAATSVLSFRGRTRVEFRFLPDAREWQVGLKWFAAGLPVIAVALWSLGLVTVRQNVNPWLALPQFIGILWVVAISEEFFFRGLLQQWIEDWTSNGVLALILASALFGAVHLAVHFYPNWRYAIVAALLGFFSGLAYRETRSIQSAMVTHALGATLYRVFFV